MDQEPSDEELELMFDAELEARITYQQDQEDFWGTPEGQAQIAREEAEIERILAEGDAIEQQLLKELEE